MFRAIKHVWTLEDRDVQFRVSALGPLGSQTGGPILRSDQLSAAGATLNWILCEVPEGGTCFASRLFITPHCVP